MAASAAIAVGSQILNQSVKHNVGIKQRKAQEHQAALAQGEQDKLLAEKTRKEADDEMLAGQTRRQKSALSAQKSKSRKRQGRAGTILTGPSGVASGAATGRKSLLGS